MEEIVSVGGGDVVGIYENVAIKNALEPIVNAKVTERVPTSQTLTKY